MRSYIVYIQGKLNWFHLVLEVYIDIMHYACMHVLLHTHCFRLWSRYPHTPKQTSTQTNTLIGMMRSEIAGSKYE